MQKKFLFLSLSLVFIFSPFYLKAADDVTKAKNIILYISDGMGPQTMGLLLEYARLAPNSIYKDRESNLEKFIKVSSLGVLLNYTQDTIVTDSAAAATHFAGGEMTLPTRIGVDAADKAVESILERAQQAGKSTGLVTTTYIQDATPAAFAAHEKSRNDKKEISKQLLASNVDILLGGGEKFIDMEQAKGTDYNIVFNKEEMLKADGKILGIFGNNEMPYAIENNAVQPSLKEMSEKALSILKENKKGFFLMVEAGKVDWVAHDNDAGALLHEMVEFDDALGYLMEFTKQNKDTILIVTADHETGGFGFNYRKPISEDSPEGIIEGSFYPSFAVLDEVYNQKELYYVMKNKFQSLPKEEQTAKNMAKILSEGTSYDITEKMVLDNGTDFNKVKAAIEKRQGIVYSTTHHSSTPLLVMSYGAKGVKGYDGIYHITDLSKKMATSLKLK